MRNPTREEFLQEMRHLFDNRPSTAYQFLTAARDDDLHTAPIEDNVTDIEERKKLWHETYEALADNTTLPLFVAFAIFVVCPLAQLKDKVALIKCNRNEMDILFMEAGWHAINVLRSYVRPQSLTQSPTTPPPTMDSPNTADRLATAAAHQRDGHMCVLSGYGCPDAAHIIPLSLTHDKAKQRTLRFLESFWGPDATAVWRETCEDVGVTESPQNIICLNKHLHALWGSASFGLKPLRDRAVERNEVWVQFHWLRQGLYMPTDFALPEITDKQIHELAKCAAEGSHGFAMAGSDLDGNGRGRNDTLAHRASGIPIQTGQVFVIRAEDPRNLPSLDLLELQWHLVRLAAMSGAANGFFRNKNDEENGLPGIFKRMYEYQWGTYEFGLDEEDQEYQSDIELLDLDDAASSDTAF